MSDDNQTDGEDDWWTAEQFAELMTYAMVEGGYMPDPFGDYDLDEILSRTREVAIDEAYRKDDGRPTWVRQIFLALAEDRQFHKALARQVYLFGWSVGGRTFHGRGIREFEKAIPQQDLAERFRLYIARFHPEQSRGRGRILRGGLDAIPSQVSDEGAETDIFWEVYDVDSGFMLEDGFQTWEHAQHYINQFPEKP